MPNVPLFNRRFFHKFLSWYIIGIMVDGPADTPKSDTDVKFSSRLETVKSLNLEGNFVRFAAHVLSSGKDEHHPDLATIDLMEIPRLVPNIYIMDFRKGIEDGLLMKFAGTAVEENYPTPLQGGYLDKLYTGHDAKELFMETYRRSYLYAESFFTRRIVHYVENDAREKYRLATALFFVCFNESDEVNYGIGFAKYEFCQDKVDPVFHLI